MHEGGAFVRSLIALLLWLSTPVAAAAQAPTVLGGVDVYRSASVTSEWLEREHGELLKLLLDAVQHNRFEELGPRLAELRSSLDRMGDFVYRDFGFTTSFDADTNRVFLMFDLVERGDSAARLGHLRPAPSGSVEATRAAVAEWQRYERHAIALVQARRLSPQVATCPAHHCLLGFDHPELAAFAASFDTLAAQLTDALVETVREDADADNRAAALFVLGHAEDADALLAAATYALDDPAGIVRNNALRVMAQLAGALSGDLAAAPIALPVDRVLRALDDPASSVRNKAAIIAAHLAAEPAHRASVLDHGDTLLRLLRLRQLNNHEPAYAALRALSGEAFGARDYAAWERWLETAR
jgi:hypothetical protein